MFLSLLFIEWNCEGKKCETQTGTFDVPLKYNSDSSETISIKVKRFKSRDLNIPVFVLTNGNGESNIDRINVTEYTSSFVDTNFYFVGYRGIDSNVTLPSKEINKFVMSLPNKINTAKLEKAVNKSLSGIDILDFTNERRARDVIELMEQEGISKAHLLAVGATGSLIAQQILSDFPEHIQRTVIVQSSAPSEDNEEDFKKLFDSYMKLCNAENCPYKGVKWLPEEVPKAAVRFLPLDPVKTIWVTNHELRNPDSARGILDILTSINESITNIGYNAFKSVPGPNLHNYNWFDMALHTCMNPGDKSFLAPPGLKEVCQFLPEIKFEIKNNFTTPIMLLQGELDLPREKAVSSFYSRHISHENQTKLLTKILIKKTSSMYSLKRKDVADGIEGFLTRGEKWFDIKKYEIVWEPDFSTAKMLKYAYIIAFVITSYIIVKAAVNANSQRKENGKSVNKNGAVKTPSAIERSHKEMIKKNKIKGRK